MEVYVILKSINLKKNTNKAKQSDVQLLQALIAPKKIHLGTLGHIIIQNWGDYFLRAVLAEIYSPEAAYRSTSFF